VGEEVGFDFEDAVGNGVAEGSHVAIDAGTDAGNVHGFFDQFVPLIMGLVIVTLIFEQ